jgi:hypothetical protein
MFPRTKNRKAISTVLTTMIILVASVVLGTGVVLYGTSLFQTNASSEAIATTGTQVWVDSKTSSGWAWGAFDVRNSGDKLLSVDQIQIRGQAIPFANWYFDKDPTRVTATNFQQSLNYTGLASQVTGKLSNYTGAASGAQLCGANAAALNVYLFGQTVSTASTPQLCMAQGSGPVSLAPGEKAIIYFKVPLNLLTTVDAGSASSVAVYAGKVGAPQSVTVASK